MRLYKLILTVSTLLLQTAFSAVADSSQFKLTLDPQDHSEHFSPWEKERLETFFKSTMDILPPQMKAAIGRPIFVNFVNFQEDIDQGQKSILIPSCNKEAKKETSATTLQKYGQVSKSFFQDLSEVSTIQMNRLFLNEIFLGPTQTRTYDCGHRSVYRSAIATLAHEVGHIYEDGGQWASSPEYLNLMGFKSPVLFGTPASKNRMGLRSPDIYEFADPHEAFSVNLEYFLLDPEFACRRPTVERYFENLFRYKPFPAGRCRINYVVVGHDSLDGQAFYFDLDPARLYAIDFLLADKGEQMISRWGHAMFRLVFCKSDTPIGPDCRKKDLGYHVVVSYRANLQDLVMSYWKGLFSGYPSQIFLLTMTSVIREYTRGEMRNLVSFPLKLTPEEKVDFVHRVLEQYWSYVGDYNFFSNNCSTESRDFLKGVVRSDSAQDLGYSTPVGLKEDLEKNGLIDSAADTFRPLSDSVDRAFATLTQSAATHKVSFNKTSKEFISETSAEERRGLYRTLSEKTPEASSRRKVLASFFILEDEILFHQQTDYDKTSLSWVRDMIENPEDFEKKISDRAKEVYKKIQDALKEATMAGQSLTKGYGVKMNGDEFKGAFEEAMETIRQSYLADDINWLLTEEIKKHLEPQDQEMNEIRDTKKWLSAEIKKTLPQPAP